MAICTIKPLPLIVTCPVYTIYADEDKVGGVTYTSYTQRSYKALYKHKGTKSQSGTVEFGTTADSFTILAHLSILRIVQKSSTGSKLLNILFRYLLKTSWKANTYLSPMCLTSPAYCGHTAVTRLNYVTCTNLHTLT